MSYVGRTHKADLCNATPLHHGTLHNVITKIMYKILTWRYIGGITAAAYQFFYGNVPYKIKQYLYIILNVTQYTPVHEV